MGLHCSVNGTFFFKKLYVLIAFSILSFDLIQLFCFVLTTNTFQDTTDSENINLKANGFRKKNLCFISLSILKSRKYIL